MDTNVPLFRDIKYFMLGFECGEEEQKLSIREE